MPTIIMTKSTDDLDSSMKKKAYSFLEKLRADDTLPGLHIEPIKGSVDPRVRTGRVDDNFRCVMFKITGSGEPVYVIHGTWPHDRANKIAEVVELSMNPLNGVPEVREILRSVAAPVAPSPELQPVQTPPAPVHEQPAAPASFTPPQRLAAPVAPTPMVVDKAPSWPAGVTVEALVARLGIDATWAAGVLNAQTETALTTLVSHAPVEWQGLAVLELATGTSLDDVCRDFDVAAPANTEPATADVVKPAVTDDELLEGLKHPAAAASFHWIEDDEELRRIVEEGDMGQWRIFLHPMQRQFVTRTYNGPAMLRGGAGTGKTVVAIHRARHLAQQLPTPRVLLTTFTANLADGLAADLRRLDDELPMAAQIGEPGVYVKSLDTVIRTVLQRATAIDPEGVERATQEILGVGRTQILKSSRSTLWQEVISEVTTTLPHNLLTDAFLDSEYSLVILRHGVSNVQEYVRARRAGRGVTLGRTQRAELWKLVEAYRAKARLEGTTDFNEKAAIATRWLQESGTTLFDHVIVDEAQDLAPTRLQFLRAVVAPGQNDLFISEDSHQRIYGQKITLGQLGIDIRGRSRRLTLNYRTTQQNLGWALGVLTGADFTDLDGESEDHSYMSARTGPVPIAYPYDSLAGELEGAAFLISSWLPTGEDDAAAGRATSPESIAILVRDRYRRESVVSGLADLGVDVRPVDREAPKAGMPVVMTMHRAKGLEFTHVLLFGIREGSIPLAMKAYNVSEFDRADALLRERALLYVAATRARDVLAVSWSGEASPLIPSER